jgi:hypothetical protein
LVRVSRETLPSVLFPQPPVIRFAPERDAFPREERLAVQKTRRKTVLTTIGPFIAHETVLRCPGLSSTFHCDALLTLVESRCNVAYDVLVFVGEGLFRRHRTSREVRAELIARNVRLSVSEIEYLGRKYITCLALAHRRATPRIRHAMELAGGYVLHLDATHDGDAPALMTGMDSLSEIVLANVKVPSEHADHIVPFLRKLQANYGNPRACVHDMGAGICKAVGEVFPGTPDFICHFHFLRDIGKDCLEPAYAELRKRLRGHETSSRLHALARDTRQYLANLRSQCAMAAKAIKAAEPQEDAGLMPIVSTYSLTLWVLDGKHGGDGYGFPFDRPLLDFAERLLELSRRLPQLLDLLLTDDPPEGQPIFKLALEVSIVAEDAALLKAVEELRRRSLIFDRLREAMRIATIGGGDGLNDECTTEAMSTIRQGVEKFRRELETDPKLASDFLSRKMAEQIDKYGGKLFADPIKVDAPNGPVTIYPQRTNNMLEQFFRGVRRAYRRKTGNDSMCRALHAMLADTPLVRNLDNPRYMEILLDGKTNLEELFVTLGASRREGQDGEQPNIDRILPGFGKLIKLPTLPELVIRSLSRSETVAQSN